MQRFAMHISDRSKFVEILLSLLAYDPAFKFTKNGKFHKINWHTIFGKRLTYFPGTLETNAHIVYVRLCKSKMCWEKYFYLKMASSRCDTRISIHIFRICVSSHNHYSNKCMIFTESCWKLYCFDCFTIVTIELNWFIRFEIPAARKLHFFFLRFHQ